MPEHFPRMNFLLRKLMNFRNKPQTATLVCTEAFWGELRDIS